MGDPDPKIEPRPEIGPVFHARRFDRPKVDGVARGYQLTGWYDFPDGGFQLWAENGAQKVRIDAGAATNGDAGIERHFAVTPGDVYRLTARLRVVAKTGKFKGRVNLSARRTDGSQVKEFNAAQDDVTETAVERAVEAVVPAGATFLSARVKFHTSAPGESGEGEIVAMTLERIPKLTEIPAGSRLSIYDFNVHKMQGDWPGWIGYIQEQKLAPPHLVLLQDIEHDAGREALQWALGDAFGGTWSGRGSDPQWQTAIVWRTGRFSNVTSRVWRGFGGDPCADNSQDAPAVQVKLYDKVAKRWVCAVSLKTPPRAGDAECVMQNMNKVNGSFNPPWAADLYVVGTDANSPDRAATGEWVPWYPATVRSPATSLVAASTLGFTDPVADRAGGDTAVLEEHATLGRRRVDYLLLRSATATAPVVVRQMTLPLGNALGVKWSDHRSLHAEVAY